MKEFEKWYRNSIFAKPCHILLGDPLTGGVLKSLSKKDIEDIWKVSRKAALEWALSQAKPDDYLYPVIDSEDIEKELND